MKLQRVFGAWLVLVMAVAVSACGPFRDPGCGADGIPNFHKVSGNVYRGGQPTEDGWDYLASLGVRTVVKLNYPFEGTDAGALKRGMRVVDASGPPSGVWDVSGAPSPGKLERALSTMEKESEGPVYVHCLHGQDRTGLMVGMYRVSHDGYSPSAAYKEMCAMGFHREFVGLRRSWKRFNQNRARDGVVGAPLSRTGPRT